MGLWRTGLVSAAVFTVGVWLTVLEIEATSIGVRIYHTMREIEGLENEGRRLEAEHQVRLRPGAVERMAREFPYLRPGNRIHPYPERRPHKPITYLPLKKGGSPRIPPSTSISGGGRVG